MSDCWIRTSLLLRTIADDHVFNLVSKLKDLVSSCLTFLNHLPPSETLNLISWLHLWQVRATPPQPSLNIPMCPVFHVCQGSVPGGQAEGSQHRFFCSSALRGGCIKVWHMWMSFCFCPSFMSSPPPFIFYQTTSPLTWWSPSGLWCSGAPVVDLTCMSSKTYRGSGPALVGEVKHWGRVPIKRSFSPDQLVWVHTAETSLFRLIMEFFSWNNCPSMGGVIIKSRLSPPGVDFTCRLFFFHCVCFTVIGCQCKKLVG